MGHRLIVKCATCSMPAVLIFNDDDLIEKAFFVCKCPRPTVEEANRAIREDEGGET